MLRFAPPSARGAAWRAWARLLRLPNGLTVPGDPWAGFVLAAGAVPSFGQAAFLATAALLLYYGGIVLNDWHDRFLDARERPERPLPAGQVSPTSAVWVGGGLLALGMLCALPLGWRAAGVALVLLLVILGYDLGGKAHGVLGPLLMGGCRGLAVLLGAAAAGGRISAFVWGVVLLHGAYVAAVTLYARGENEAGAPSRLAVWPPLVLFFGGLLLWTRTVGHLVALGLYVLAILWAAAAAYRACTGAPWQKRRAVGAWLGGLTLLQAGWLIQGSTSYRFALLPLAAGLIFWFAARRIPAS